jgi:NAD(P)-dependent dehydrogenase (short-subunit alcohol dehydrogenase family)
VIEFVSSFSTESTSTNFNLVTGRGGSDADMAGCILFLVSPAGVFLNNQLLHPDGGQMIVAPAAI